MTKTLFAKVWNEHTVRVLPTGQEQLFVGLHLVHEVTSPQAFDMLRLRRLPVAFPRRTVATVTEQLSRSDAERSATAVGRAVDDLVAAPVILKLI